MPPAADHARFGPPSRLLRNLRRRLSPDPIVVWLLKRALRRQAKERYRRHTNIDPLAWREMWKSGDIHSWPTEMVTGVFDAGEAKIAIDRCEITSEGHLWIEGWTTADIRTSFEVAGRGCTILWQSACRTPRKDVIEALKLSLRGREAEVGFEIIAKVADQSAGKGHLALCGREGGGELRFITPLVPQLEWAGSLWHTFYQRLGDRPPRSVPFLQCGLRLLKEVRKADWRERARPARQAIDDQMPGRSALKVLLLSRNEPNVAYLNLHLLAAALDAAADFTLCSIGPKAIHRASEYGPNLSSVHHHRLAFVSAEAGTPSSELIECFAASAARRGCPALIVNDDVSVAGAIRTIAESAARTKDGGLLAARIWPRQIRPSAPPELPFLHPLASRGGLGPYWRLAADLLDRGVGAVLFDPARSGVPDIPPFEGRGHGLEYLSRTVLKEAMTAAETLIDLLDSASQGEATTLDLLMLIGE